MINNMTDADYKKIAELDEQLKLYPNNLELLMQKAFVYFDGYDDENIIKTYKHIIELYPKYVDAYFWLSYYLFQIASRTAEAIQIAKQGLKVDPNNGGLYAVIAWSVDFMDGNKNEFLDAIKTSIELEPTWISTRISLIGYLIKNKEFDEAKKEIAKANSQIQDNFPAPQNDLEYQFECDVTRRFDKTSRHTLQKLLEEIKKVN